MAMAMERFDRISALPDAVICHILSFLPTKLAVTTSILSKRWIPLWLSVPVLDFNEYKETNTNAKKRAARRASVRFFRMVYSVMLKREAAAQPVKTFRLTCSEENCLCDSSDVSTWISAVVQRGVERLELRLLRRIKLHSGILSCRTLVVMELCNLSLKAKGAFAADGLPSLKVMRLICVHFVKLRYVMQFLAGCPNLEYLTLFTLFVDDVIADMCVHHPTVINNIANLEFPTLNKLVRAECSYTESCIPLKWICEVKSMSLLETFPNYKITCAFRNLTFLELTASIYNWDWFFEVLQHCPKLEIFVIVKDAIFDDEDPDDEMLQPEIVPECLSSNLKLFSIINYRGYESELQFAKYIMQNAKVLCSVRIYSTKSMDPLEKFEMLKKLSLCPRSSETCELIFE